MKCKIKLSKLNKVQSHEYKVLLAKLNHTLNGVQYKKIKILLCFYIMTKNKKAHIILNE